jgi:hypothetical protein
MNEKHPIECPLSRGAVIGDNDGRNCYLIAPHATYQEICRRWRIAPTAERLVRALDMYLMARHNGQPDEQATVDLLNARQEYEREPR